MRKRVLTVLAALCGLFIWGGAEVQASEGNQLPVLSGTTEIEVLKDSLFDTGDILNRVYAMDYEDGDLTQKIEIISNTVDTSQTGSYSVVYEVTDSDNGKAQLTTTVEVAEAYTENAQRIQKTLYMKESADHLLNVELYRGYYHDRQHLGIYLNEGTSLKIRIAGLSDYYNDISMDLLGNDSNVEKTYTIPGDGSWLTIPAEDVTEDMVPFIRTPQTDVEGQAQPVLEYYYVNENGMEPLTYYCYGDDQAAFLDTWNTNGHDYAVIEGERITMLIPAIDKDSILNNSTAREEYQFKTIDDMLEYYQEMQEQYDTYAGLSYDPEVSTDKNVRARYFAKADASGVGAAYYSGSAYTAENSESMNGYLKIDWMSMHEVAHGYDTSIAHGDLTLVETINNIFGYFYQKELLADGDNGWSNMQNLALCEETYYNQLEDGQTFDTMDLDARLFFFINLLSNTDTGAEAMMAELYQAWRTNPGVNTADFIVEHFSNTSGCNLIPYFELYDIYADDWVKSRIYEKDYPVLVMFADHFEDKAAAEAALPNVGDAVTGLYGLIEADELAVLQMTGNAEITVEIDDINQILGKKARLLNGTKEVASADITSSEIIFNDLPIGTYHLELPAAAGMNYYTEYVDITVVAGKTIEETVKYQKAAGNLMADDISVQFKGLSNTRFAVLETDTAEGTVTVTTESVQPHSYFTDVYASVEILSAGGETLYTRNYIGSEQQSASSDIVNASVGSVIRITHQEMTAGRLAFVSLLTNEVCTDFLKNNSTQSVELVITENGLKPVEWEDKEFDQVRKGWYEAAIKKLSDGSDNAKERNTYQEIKAKIVSGITSLDEESQAYFEKEYGFLFEEEGLTPEVKPTPTPEAKPTPTPEVKPTPTPEVEAKPTPTPEVKPTPTPDEKPVLTFEDVKEEDFHYDAVLWALEKNVTTGYDAKTFGTWDDCTRGQIVTFLWRAAGSPTVKNADCTFTDVSKDAYYYNAVLWAVSEDITTGYNATTFGSEDECTRGQIVTFLWRAKGQDAPKTEKCDFSDISSTDYYYNAVLWAVENEITKGQTAIAFAPNKICNRAEAVTFLYRAFN